MLSTAIATERREFAGYCANCTTAQLENVYRREKDRARRYGDNCPVGDAARRFAAAAKAELKRRNAWPV